jgi:hypothetical protein
VARADSVRAHHGSVSRVSLDGTTEPLFWSANLGASAAFAGPGRVVFVAAASRTHLREQRLDGGGERWLTQGHAVDRQPTYSPDGTRLLFSSNRSGNLDLWELELASGVLRRLTDEATEDWDPDYVGDGRRIVWSSRRSGHFEIWIANADGSAARQLTADGVDAENPTSSPDGRWITYTSLNPAHRGIWKIRDDGSQAQLLLAGDHGLAEISPDGRHVLYRTDPGPPRFGVEVIRLADGVRVPGFSVLRNAPPAQTRGVVQGRARWRPDGGAIAFVGPDDRSVSGIWLQDFAAGRDTAGSLHPLAGFDLAWGSESFDFSPDGGRLAIAVGEQTMSLVMAEGVSGMD